MIAPDKADQGDARRFGGGDRQRCWGPDGGDDRHPGHRRLLHQLEPGPPGQHQQPSRQRQLAVLQRHTRHLVDRVVAADVLTGKHPVFFERNTGREPLQFYFAALLIKLFNTGVTHLTLKLTGAIAGVLGAYFVLYPRAEVLTVVPIFFYPLFFEMPAVVFLGLPYLW